MRVCARGVVRRPGCARRLRALSGHVVLSAAAGTLHYQPDYTLMLNPQTVQYSYLSILRPRRAAQVSRAGAATHRNIPTSERRRGATKINKSHSVSWILHFYINSGCNVVARPSGVFSNSVFVFQ